MFPTFDDIWSISTHNFNDYALEIFRLQVKSNPVYKKYVELIDKEVESITAVEDIPFMPISFFKSHEIKSFSFETEAIFKSSSTTGQGQSSHAIASLDNYRRNSLTIIQQTVGILSNYSILGLLPNYLEQGNSSLVYMVNSFMQETNLPTGFYLDEFDALATQLSENHKNGIKTLLFGVSFALLDFAEQHCSVDSQLTIIETGGMKGRKKEIIKKEVYEQIQHAFPNAVIRSEYGMTELMSQCYSDENAIYSPPPWFKVLSRPDNDPMSIVSTKSTAALNIIDLANIHSCCFLATDDLGRIHADGTFEVLGRLDYSDIRGCSLLI